MNDAVKLCKDCRHYKNDCCKHDLNMRTDYVNGGVAVRNSADFLRADGNRCGADGKWWEERVK